MKVLHINNVARIGELLVSEARKQKLEWDLYDIARVNPNWPSHLRPFLRAARGSVWEAGLARRVFSTDLINLHGGNIRRHTGWIRKPYVLHLHGSDVRTVRLQEKQGKIIDRAIEQAEQVYYTTPDLAECTLPLRPDAQLQPVVVEINNIPYFDCFPVKPKIIFPSRWGPEKGGEFQIELAVLLRRTLGSEVVFEGLNWGQNAARAAKVANIKLLPKMPMEKYYRWLGNATAAVGQTTGVLGVSELEVLATGTPLVSFLEPNWYNGTHSTMRKIPIYGGIEKRKYWLEGYVEETKKLLKCSKRVSAREWIAAEHGPKIAVTRLQECYNLL